MGLVEIGRQAETLSQRQRWSLYLTIALALVTFYIGMNLRDSILYATVQYTDPQAGIRANYPLNWLIDTDGNYIFRVRDLSRRRFNTTIEVAIIPINTAVTSERNVLDSLTLSRAQLLASYNVQSVAPFQFREDVQGTSMTYSFVATGSNPFLANVPVVVQGIDVLVLRGSQAIVITFQTSVETYEQDIEIFQRFLADLEF